MYKLIKAMFPVSSVNKCPVESKNINKCIHTGTIKLNYKNKDVRYVGKPTNKYTSVIINLHA